MKGVGEATGRGDYRALRVIRRFSALIGQTLASAVNVLHLSMMVIGGGISRLADALLGEVRSAVHQRSLPLATKKLPIIMGELDEAPRALGASVRIAKGVISFAYQ